MDRVAEASSLVAASKRVIPAPPEEVFEAWVNPILLRQWFCPFDRLIDRLDVDARPGGAYLIEIRDDNGIHYRFEGTYLEVDPPRRLVMTWTQSADDPLVEGALVTRARDTRLTVDFRPAGDAETEVLLLHERFANASVARGHGFGWQSVLDGLNDLMRSKD